MAAEVETEMLGATDLDRRLGEAAIRLFRRYQVEIVEAFDLCPWATVAREQGRVQERVVADAAPSVEQTLEAVRALAEDESVEIGIVLFPRIELGRPAFERFVAAVRERETERCLPDAAPFAMAEFHPEAPAVLAPAGAFTSFVRRTPDPTIQLVRQTALARVRKTDKGHGTGFFDISKIGSIEELERSLGEGQGPPIHERVLAQNRATFAKQGVERMADLFAELRRDRERTYSALGIVRSP